MCGFCERGAERRGEERKGDLWWFHVVLVAVVAMVVSKVEKRERERERGSGGYSSHYIVRNNGSCLLE